MKTKNKIVLGFVALALLALSVPVHAANGDESARAAGTTYTDEGVSADSNQVRIFRSDNSGRLWIEDGSLSSTMTNVQSSTVTSVLDSTSAFQLSTSTNPVNPNVWGNATSTEPLHLDFVQWMNATNVRVRIFDTRGSTDTTQSSVKQICDQVASTGTVIHFDNVYLSSGLTTNITLLGTATGVGTGQFDVLFAWHETHVKTKP